MSMLQAMMGVLGGGNDEGFITTIVLTTGGSVNLRTLADNAGYNGTDDATVTYTLANGQVITASAGDNDAIDTGTWPAVTLALDVSNSGIIRGGGGSGGDGGSSGGNGLSGLGGGDAINCQENITIVNNATGVIDSGGGGGGGGNAQDSDFGGNGGGGGYPNGIGGSAGTGNIDPGVDGSDGTTSGGGAGPGAAGAGGDAGADGEAGDGGAGSAGFAIRFNGNTVSVTNNGTINGSTS